MEKEVKREQVSVGRVKSANTVLEHEVQRLKRKVDKWDAEEVYRYERAKKARIGEEERAKEERDIKRRVRIEENEREKVRNELRRDRCNLK